MTAEQSGRPDLLDPVDEVAVLRLYQQYNDLIDRGDTEAWAQLWTNDGVFDHPARTYRGRPELEAFVQDRAAALATQSETNHRHWNADIRLTKYESRVIGTCSLLVSVRDRDSGAGLVATTGAYSDVVVQVDGRWHFASRCLRVD